MDGGNGKLEVDPSQKRYGAIQIGLRGTLAEEYEFRHSQNEAAATEWVRVLTQKAFNKDPDLLVKVELHVHSGEKRYLIGRKSEVGMYPPHW